MKILLTTVALSILPIAASAQDMPKFMKDVAPDASAAPAWQEYMAVMNPNGALDDKTKQLIALGVAAQIPCQYCIYAHTLAAKHGRRALAICTVSDHVVTGEETTAVERQQTFTEMVEIALAAALG